MRNLKWTAVISMLILAGCAGQGDRASTIRQGLTNALNEDGIPYVTNGDEFADAQAKLPVAGQTAAQKLVKDSLGDRIREYDFTRWDSDSTDPNEAKRFGSKRWELNVRFRRARTVKLTGTFAKTAKGLSLVSSERASRFIIQDSVLTDEIKPYEKTRLHFKLTDTRKKESVLVSFYAFLGRFEVREDSANKPAPGSVLECQIKTLHDSTMAWSNNWTTLPGRVFFYNDLVHTANPKDAAQDCLPSKITIRGESLATSIASDSKDPEDGDKLVEHSVESTLGQVTMVGNPAQGNRRMFIASLEDKQSATKNDVVLTVVPQDEADADLSDDDQAEFVTEPKPEPPARRNKPSTQPTPAPARTTLRRSAPVPELPPARPGDAFLSTVAGDQAASLVRDFNRNRNLRGVRDFMDQYQGKSRATLQAFYTNANPFRPMLEAISRAYDVVGWAYLTVVESAYFTGGVYQNKIRGDFSKKLGYDQAWGPFQFHEAAAKQSGLLANNRRGSDERDYFAPAACGAASYMVDHIRQYPNDRTIAILAYNQGGAGAAARIYCGYHPDQSGRQNQCIKDVKQNPKYNLYVRLANNYRYTYAEMTGFSVLTPAMMDYVNKKLAIFFISQNPTAYGFNLSNGKRSLPTNGTVMPPNGRLNSQQCADAIKGTY